MVSPAYPRIGMGHVAVDRLSRRFHPVLNSLPLLLVKHVTKLCVQAGGVSAVQASELTETAIATFGSPLQESKTTRTATVVASSGSPFTNQRLEGRLLADVAQDCCKGIFVSDAFVLQEVKGFFLVV